jgi:hypothetical protein
MSLGFGPAQRHAIYEGQEEALQYRREFLRDRLAQACDINDKEKHAKLLAIIHERS